MRLSLDHNDGFLVSSYGPGRLVVGDRDVRSSVVVASDRLEPWPPARFEDLAETHFATLLEWRPELVLLGTGVRQRFPDPRVSRPLLEAGVGVEAMDTAAACRTFNIVTAEGRRVVAALLMIETDPA